MLELTQTLGTEASCQSRLDGGQTCSATRATHAIDVFSCHVGSFERRVELTDDALGVASATGFELAACHMLTNVDGWILVLEQRMGCARECTLGGFDRLEHRETKP